jgi:hypothetical protein
MDELLSGRPRTIREPPFPRTEVDPTVCCEAAIVSLLHFAQAKEFKEKAAIKGGFLLQIYESSGDTQGRV